MKGSAENRAPGTSEKSGGKDVVLTWFAARRMLPLVQRIVADIVGQHQQLAQLRPEKASLDGKKRTLAWPERARRYQLQEDIAAAERHLHEAAVELEALGVALLNSRAGLVGFPTIVNDRKAYFSWQTGEEGLQHWQFADEDVRHAIPLSWMKIADGRLTGKGPR